MTEFYNESNKKIEKEEQFKKVNEKYKNFKYYVKSSALMQKLYIELSNYLEKYYKNNEDYRKQLLILLKNYIDVLPQNFSRKDFYKVAFCTKNIIEKNKEYFPRHKEMYNLYYDFGNFVDSYLFIYANDSKKKYLYFKKYIDSSYNDAYSYICVLALLFIYNTTYIKDIEIFINSDLYSITNKLFNETNKFDYIYNKVYDLYFKLYKDIFVEELNKNQIIFLIYLVCYQKKIRLQKNQILGIKIDSKINEFIEKEKSLTFHQKFELLCENIFNNKELNVLINKDKDVRYFFIINYAIEKFNDDIDILEELLFMWNTIETLNKKYSNQFEIEEAKKERDRILNGNMSRERKLQELEYSNIENGYEFEKYIANLYKKLGYIIEEITKKSKDYRSRYNSM